MVGVVFLFVVPASHAVANCDAWIIWTRTAIGKAIRLDPWPRGSVAGVVSCLAQLGIPDLLEHGPKSAEELASQIGAQPEALYRLMRATACVGVLAEDSDGKFSQTPMSAVLCSEAQLSLRGLAIMGGRELHGRGWSYLEYCVKTGKQAIDKIYGMPIFELFLGESRRSEDF